MSKLIYFKAWKILDAQKQLIAVQWVMLGALSLFLLLTIFGWRGAMQTFRVYVPPSLAAGGGTTHINHVPKATVYAFAFQIFSAVNSWPDGGRQDYEKNILSYARYFSGGMAEDLKQDYRLRSQEGALDRKRIVAAVAGDGYDPNKIKYIGNGVWTLDLTMDVEETVNNMVVKHVIMDYPLRIERVDSSIQVNPWGLVIAGFTGQPKRIKTLV